MREILKPWLYRIAVCLSVILLGTVVNTFGVVVLGWPIWTTLVVGLAEGVVLAFVIK